eukprot:gene3554-11043_t
MPGRRVYLLFSFLSAHAAWPTRAQQPPRYTNSDSGNNDQDNIRGDDHSGGSATHGASGYQGEWSDHTGSSAGWEGQGATAGTYADGYTEGQTLGTGGQDREDEKEEEYNNARSDGESGSRDDDQGSTGRTGMWPSDDAVSHDYGSSSGQQGSGGDTSCFANITVGARLACPTGTINCYIPAPAPAPAPQLSQQHSSIYSSGVASESISGSAAVTASGSGSVSGSGNGWNVESAKEDGHPKCMSLPGQKECAKMANVPLESVVDAPYEISARFPKGCLYDQKYKTYMWNSRAKTEQSWKADATASVALLCACVAQTHIERNPTLVSTATTIATATSATATATSVPYTKTEFNYSYTDGSVIDDLDDNATPLEYDDDRRNNETLMNGCDSCHKKCVLNHDGQFQTNGSATNQCHKSCDLDLCNTSNPLSFFNAPVTDVQGRNSYVIGRHVGRGMGRRTCAALCLDATKCVAFAFSRSIGQGCITYESTGVVDSKQSMMFLHYTISPSCVAAGITTAAATAASSTAASTITWTTPDPEPVLGSCNGALDNEACADIDISHLCFARNLREAMKTKCPGSCLAATGDAYFCPENTTSTSTSTSSSASLTAKALTTNTTSTGEDCAQACNDAEINCAAFVYRGSNKKCWLFDDDGKLTTIRDRTAAYYRRGQTCRTPSTTPSSTSPIPSTTITPNTTLTSSSTTTLSSTTITSATTTTTTTSTTITNSSTNTSTVTTFSSTTVTSTTLTTITSETITTGTSTTATTSTATTATGTTADSAKAFTTVSLSTTTTFTSITTTSTFTFTSTATSTLTKPTTTQVTTSSPPAASSTAMPPIKVNANPDVIQRKEEKETIAKLKNIGKEGSNATINQDLAAINSIFTTIKPDADLHSNVPSNSTPDSDSTSKGKQTTPILTIDIIKSATAAMNRIMEITALGFTPSSSENASSAGLASGPSITEEDFEAFFETANHMFKETPATTLSGSQVGEPFTLPKLIEDMGELAVLTLTRSNGGKGHNNFKTDTMTCTGIMVGKSEMASGIEWPAKYSDSDAAGTASISIGNATHSNKGTGPGGADVGRNVDPVNVRIPSATILAATRTRQNAESGYENKTAATVSVLVVDYKATAGLFPDPTVAAEGTAAPFLGSAVVAINISDTLPGSVLAEPIILGFDVEASQAFSGGRGKSDGFVNPDAAEADASSSYEEEDISVVVQYLPVCVWWDFTLTTRLHSAAGKAGAPTVEGALDGSDNADISAARQIKGGWNSSGCITQSSGWETSKHVNCTCNHLTHFGILFQTQEIDHRLETDALQAHESVLSAITITGVSINTLCLILMVGIFWHYMRKELSTVATKILLHLCTALVASQLVFVAGIERRRHSTDASCSSVAYMIHYLLLVSWAWMVSESIHLRERFIIVYQPSVNVKWFAVASYIVPAVIVGISAGLYHDDYGTEDMCWIRPGSSAIWFFVVPVLLALAVNIWIFINVVRAVTDEVSSKWTSLKAAVTFMVTLGLTNGFGALIVIKGNLIWHYLLAVSLALQGLAIFYFHCWRRLQNRPKRKTVSNIKSAIKKGRMRKRAGASSATNDSKISGSPRASAATTESHGRSGLATARISEAKSAQGYENPTYGQLHGGLTSPTPSNETKWEKESVNNDKNEDLYESETPWNNQSIDGSYLEAGGTPSLNGSSYIELQDTDGFYQEGDDGDNDAMYTAPISPTPRPFSPEWDNSFMSPAAAAAPPASTPNVSGEQIGRRFVSTPTPTKPTHAGQRRVSAPSVPAQLAARASQFPSKSPFMKGRMKRDAPAYGLPPQYSPQPSKENLGHLLQSKASKISLI